MANIIVWQCRHETRLQKEGGELVGEQVKSRFAACALSPCADRECRARCSLCCLPAVAESMAGTARQ